MSGLMAWLGSDLFPLTPYGLLRKALRLIIQLNPNGAESNYHERSEEIDSDSNYSLLLFIVDANSEPLRAGAGAIRARNFRRMKYSKFDLSARQAARRYVLNFK
jgi:hypothetical protein